MGFRQGACSASRATAGAARRGWSTSKGASRGRTRSAAATDIAAFDKTVVVPAGGRIGVPGRPRASGRECGRGAGARLRGQEYPASFGQAIGEDDAVYVQWHRRDNSGRVEIFRLAGRQVVKTDFVPGTETAIHLPGLMSFCFGERPGRRRLPLPAGGRASASAGTRPARRSRSCWAATRRSLRRSSRSDHAVFGGLDGRLYVVPLSGRARRGRSPRPSGRRSPRRPRLRRADLLRLRRRISVRARAGRQAPLPQRTWAWRRSAIRSSRQSGRTGNTTGSPTTATGLHQRQRPGRQAAVPHQVDAPLRRHVQAPAGLRRRADVHPHLRRPDHRRRTGDRPAAVAALLARRVSVVHLAALLPRAAAGAAGRA